MALYLSPLVDVNEIDLSTTIPAVATSIAVTVLRETYKGPEMKRQLITSVDELIETFGEPTSASYKDILSATGYLKYGNKLYCTRVLPENATFAGAFVTPAASADFTARTKSTAHILTDLVSLDPDEYGDESCAFTGAASAASISIIAKSRGKWGNFIKVAMIGRDAYDAIREQYGDSSYTRDFGMTAELINDVADVDKLFSDDREFLIIVKAADQDEISKASPTYSVVETWLVSSNERAVDDEGGSIFVENMINTSSDYIRIAVTSTFKNSDMSEVLNQEYWSLGGGVDQNDDTIADSDIIDAYELYEDPELVDVNIFIDSDKSTTVKDSVYAICEARKDAMAIFDVPSSLVINNRGNEATDCRDFRLGNHSTYNLNINTSYAALYANWLEVYDKWNARYRWIPASGHIAGIYANTDDVSDPWFAPAGLNRGIISNVRKLAWNPTQGHRDVLYSSGINPIVSFSGQGKVVWGQKNLLDKSSAFNRVNVRRLFMILAKSISTALKYFLFEPNDGFTRLQLINMIDPFLRDVKARRGIYDYLIVCDSRNNTPERIDRNELWCDIYIKPTRAAEFIVLNLIATKTGASFTELVQSTTPA